MARKDAQRGDFETGQEYCASVYFNGIGAFEDVNLLFAPSRPTKTQFNHGGALRAARSVIGQ